MNIKQTGSSITLIVDKASALCDGDEYFFLLRNGLFWRDVRAVIFHYWHFDEFSSPRKCHIWWGENQNMLSQPVRPDGLIGCSIFGHLQPINNCPTALIICQNRFKVLPNTILALNKWPNIFKISPKWQNFAKSGHTGSNQPHVRLIWLSHPFSVARLDWKENYHSRCM